MEKIPQGITEIYEDGILSLQVCYLNRVVKYLSPKFPESEFNKWRKYAWLQIADLMCEEIQNDRLIFPPKKQEPPPPVVYVSKAYKEHENGYMELVEPKENE